MHDFGRATLCGWLWTLTGFGAQNTPSTISGVQVIRVNVNDTLHKLIIHHSQQCVSFFTNKILYFLLNLNLKNQYNTCQKYSTDKGTFIPLN